MVVSATRTLGMGLHPLQYVSGILGSVQTHDLSRARLIFLVVLVVFFCALFIGAYVWMRRPSFGQGGGRPAPGAVESNGVDKKV